MAFTLDKVVPWGRSLDEYVRMFNLPKDDLRGKILGCGDGPSSFNSEMRQRGYKVISCAPLYRFTAEEIKGRIDETYDTVLEQTSLNKNNFVWDTIKSVKELGKVRMDAMIKFLKDYDLGKKAGRYIAASLPKLPFASKQFDLALCPHFFFLYTEQLSLDFHRKSLHEMCRVAKEVRIFPLIDLKITRSPYIDTIIPELEEHGYDVRIEKVSYEFQCGGDEMMRIMV